MFTRNWTLKVSALGIAVLLWFSVRVEAPGRQTLTVPVRVDLSDPEWVMDGDPEPATVEIRFSGESGDLARLIAERPTILVPVDDVQGSDTTVVVRNQWVRMQDRPGLRVEDIQPATVALRFEPVDRTSLPVAWRLEGQLPDTLALRAWPRPEPGEVRVTGRRSLLSERDSIRLEPLDLTGVSTSGPRAMRVDTARVSGLQVLPMSVDLNVQVERREERDVEGVPVSLDREVAELFQEVPSTWTVQLSGAPSRIRPVQPGTLRLVPLVDLDNLPEPGEEIGVPFRLEGLPEFVRGTPTPSEVVLVVAEPGEGSP
ncbi:MAG: hypothetical protein EA352_04070 [Gemmatimonadales bacterium]|nr:MAG: hypothetical protein EA352_04070 [Gemmatimonadales bacterium]